MLTVGSHIHAYEAFASATLLTRSKLPDTDSDSRCSNCPLATTNDQWERLMPLLPPQRPRVGRPTEDHRRLIDAFLWMVRTGAPWRDVPDRYVPRSTLVSQLGC